MARPSRWSGICENARPSNEVKCNVFSLVYEAVVLIKAPGGDRFCITSTKTVNFYLADFNPRLPIFYMAYGINVIIFFACLVIVYVCTKFGDFMTNFIFA